MQGIVLVNAVQTIIAKVLAGAGREKVLTGKRGRPVKLGIESFANKREREFPAGIESALTDNVDLIGGFLDALASSRREMTPDEAEYVMTGRDAEAMGLLDGEPVQSDVYSAHPVIRHEGESLGLAFRRRMRDVAAIAQIEANAHRKTMFVYVCRFAVERNLRDRATAVKYEAPLSAVGLMSRNIVQIIITDTPKAYAGALPRCAKVEPEPKAKRVAASQMPSTSMVTA
jgi:hypothetical protein